MAYRQLVKVAHHKTPQPAYIADPASRLPPPAAADAAADLETGPVLFRAQDHAEQVRRAHQPDAVLLDLGNGWLELKR